MRDRIGRTLLFSIGIFAIGAGILGLMGMSNLARGTSILVGIGAIGGGISMVRSSRRGVAQ
ncbi:MAG TPA: hypothetical protein VFO55_03180 [Gemmatimonadaceae bacterium]|nr:hypothetical protein [Gemmatimonadaceae bacterium]